MKILIVDDDPCLRDLVRLALERAGFQVITAADGQSALTHATRELPDMIALDIGLPEVDGLEICRRTRRRSDVPVLFLTARDDEIDCILGLKLGADDYLTKPFSERELVARMRAILKQSSGMNGSLPEGADIDTTSVDLTTIKDQLRADVAGRLPSDLRNGSYGMWGSSTWPTPQAG